MTQPIQMYRSHDGSIHETEFASLKADLKHMLVQSDAINEASAAKLVAWLTDPRENLAGMAELVEMLYDKHPEASRVDEQAHT